MEKSNQLNEKSSSNGFSLEILKALSLFLSSVVIALTGTLLTYRYNSSQLEINRNKELSVLIPRLYSADPKEKMQSVIGLSLYGESAVLPLMSLWGYDANNVPLNMEIINSIVYIGDIAIPYLLKVYNNPAEDDRKRSYVLFALIRLNYKDSKSLIKDKLYHIDNDPQVLVGAARSAGLIDYKEMTPRLVQISKAFRKNPDPDYIYLVSNIAFALKYLGGKQAKEEIKELLDSPYSTVREEAIKSMTVLGDKNDIPKLTDISLQDSIQNIRQLAWYAIKAIEINSEQNLLKPQ